MPASDSESTGGGPLAAGRGAPSRAAAPRLVTLGEALVDMIGGASLATTHHFTPAAGGAPANVAVGAARLGLATAFIGKVGADAFGDFLAATLAHEGVDLRGLTRDATARTALAFVSLGAGGERDFLFYRERAADAQLTPAEVDGALVAGARALHVGSLSLVEEPARSATRHALAVAAGSGVARSFDPNLRLDLWSSPEAARATILATIPLVTVLKVSDDELEFLTGSRDLAAAAALLHPELRLLCVTRGAAGVDYLARPYLARPAVGAAPAAGPAAGAPAPYAGSVPSFPVAALDTTGAGDAFTAALLTAWCTEPGLTGDRATLEAALRRANAFAALTVTRHGAIPALPTRAELEAFLAAAPAWNAPGRGGRSA